MKTGNLSNIINTEQTVRYLIKYMLNDYLFQYKEAGMEEEKDFKFDKRAEYYDESFYTEY